MKTFHIATESGKNARVPIGRTQPSQTKVTNFTKKGEPVTTERVHRGTPNPLLTAEDLIKGDPEVNCPLLGMVIEDATRGYRIPGENELVGDFQKMVTAMTPTGEVKEKTPHSPKAANVDETNPVKMGKRISHADAFSKFVFHNHYAISHDDGVKYEFLHGIAKELWEKKELAILGAGPKGTNPLVFRDAGTPYRAFLYGECEAEKYKLLVLITRMELKKPEAKDTKDAEATNPPQP